MRRLLAVLVVAHMASLPVPVLAAGAVWEQWKTVGGVFDVDGPRSDGSLIVAGLQALYLADPAGTVKPFALGDEDAGAEAYLAMSTGGHVGAAACDFAADETYLLRLRPPIGVDRVSAAGDQSGPFVNVAGVGGLNGIAFDHTGAFDHRLLVSGPAGTKTAILAIDCTGAVQTITSTAPVLEGGLAVAPAAFGAFGGALIAPDELSGNVYAIGATGAVSLVVKPDLPAGGDIGVESVGFVPAGFISRGGFVYYADRLTPGNPHPGSDSLMRLAAAQLAAGGVQDGDLLVATEGGATMVAVHCEASCTVISVVTAATKAHGEGHLAFTMGPAPPGPIQRATAAAPAAGRSAQLVLLPAIAVVLIVALLAAVGVQAAIRRRPR
jgi:hypothetical protein